MNVVEATSDYEDWLATNIALDVSDIALKHQLMHDSAFAFLRATYYRWIELSAKHCAEMAKAPQVLSVGDLHIENFGTWRDSEGRLAWGINDFDEADHLPYTSDLVRLSASVLVAIDAGLLSFDGKKACAEILDGYADAICAQDAASFILEEAHSGLRDLAMSGARGPRKFWRKITTAEKIAPPPAAKKILSSWLPRGTRNIVYVRRTAGTGGLGIPRFVAWGRSHGGLVAREAKARTPTAHCWARGIDARPAPFTAILKQAVRVPDPGLHVAPHWIVRRLGPHCERIELGEIADARARREVLNAMGRETANTHWGDRKAAALIAEDLKERKASWLYRHAARMADATLNDWRAWRKRR
jgi:hypothetical protein